MASSPFHDSADLGEIHKPHNWEYASAAARDAASGFAAGDVNKIALQLDDYSFWILTDHTTSSWRKLSSPIFDNRGNYDASTNLFPATGGSGGAGAVVADDIWYISIAGTLGGTPVVVGDAIRALVDVPAQVAANWQIFPKNIETLGLQTIIKDTANGIVGKSSDNIHFMNIARTFKSLINNVNTAIRTYVFPDMSGDILALGTPVTVVAALSTLIGASKSAFTNITGSIAQITSFDIVAVGVYRRGYFTGQCEIVHNDTSLITPHMGNINTEDGDYYEAISLGSGNWRIMMFRPRSGDIPVGTELIYMGGTVQDGCVLEDGANVLRLGKYARLYAKIGTVHGVGDGSTTFGLPDSRRRVSVGKGGTGTGDLGNAIGNTGGEEGHNQTEAELAAHTHTMANQVNADVGFFRASFGGATNTPTSSTGSSDPMNVIQPSIVVTKMIKY